MILSIPSRCSLVGPIRSSWLRRPASVPILAMTRSISMLGVLRTACRAAHSALSDAVATFGLPVRGGHEESRAFRDRKVPDWRR